MHLAVVYSSKSPLLSRKEPQKSCGCFFGGFLLLAWSASLAHAGDWPQFRGPNGSATSKEKDLPAAWGADKNVAWKAKLPGYGWSSPIIWGDKVFVTTA